VKLISLLLISLSVITFRSCGDLEGHENVQLEVNPVYSGGVLSLTPYVLYEGEEEETFEFGSNIAWIDKIENGEEVIYEFEAETLDIDQQTTLEKGDQRNGSRVELELGPGSYDVYMSASYFIKHDLNEDSGEPMEYFHEKIQTVEIQP
jgi:hypothetical protein